MSDFVPLRSDSVNFAVRFVDNSIVRMRTTGLMRFRSSWKWAKESPCGPIQRNLEILRSV